jgi:hypothetical protein
MDIPQTEAAHDTASLFPVIGSRVQHRISQSASHRGCPKLFNLSPLEDAGTLGHGGTGRHDVIDGDGIAFSDAGRIDDAGCASHVLQPIRGGKNSKETAE